MPSVLIQNPFDARILLDIPSPMNNVLNGQVALKLIDTCLTTRYSVM